MHRVRFNFFDVTMNPAGTPVWAPLRAEPIPCAECGSRSRVGRGLCLNCLLRQGLGADTSNKETLEDVLAEIDVRDPDRRLGNYQILDEIAHGGMGVIYRARQRHSRRVVALKRILAYEDSQETLIRFRREALAAASLDHPNILPIYEVGEDEDGLPFFSMKFAAGGSLRDAVPHLRREPFRCVQLMAKVARAVEYAHSQGILHRDLKPGNILLDGRGEPLVSDFGLAKWLDANKDLTKSLTTFGTPGYTAPEQAESKTANLTPAADVYSLGAILFELLAGRPPFLGSNAVAVIRQAAETPAPKLRSLAHSHNRDLETICVRCLERDPKARYQSAGDLATDLERWLDGRPILARPVSLPTRLGRWARRNPKLVATGAACFLFGAAIIWFFRGELAKMLPLERPEKSIAVLPFLDLSQAKDQEYFCDGISEEILDALAKVDGLRVVARTSSFSFKGKNANASEVGKKLNVNNLLEGSVQREGNHIRITAELIDTRNGFHLWSETYERELQGVFALQDEITRAIVDALKIKLAISLPAHQQRNTEGYDLYLQGLYFSNKGSEEDLRRALSFFQRSLEKDPTFSRA